MKKQEGQVQQMQAVMNFDKTPMLSNEQTINVNPCKFTFDFKNICVQSTPDGAILMATHKVILLDPHMAKTFYHLLQKQIEAYENTFGEIKVPDVIIKGQELQQVQQQSTTTDVPPSSYIG